MNEMERIQAQDEYDKLTSEYNKNFATLLKARRAIEDLIDDTVTKYEQSIKPLLPHIYTAEPPQVRGKVEVCSRSTECL
jgi:hypothetical protein